MQSTINFLINVDARDVTFNTNLLQRALADRGSVCIRDVSKGFWTGNNDGYHLEDFVCSVMVVGRWASVAVGGSVGDGERVWG